MELTKIKSPKVSATFKVWPEKKKANVSDEFTVSSFEISVSDNMETLKRIFYVNFKQENDNAFDILFDAYNAKNRSINIFQFHSLSYKVTVTEKIH
jgi:hypothetical protein